MPKSIKVAILGSTGMLGSMVRRHLSTLPLYDLICPPRAILDAESITTVRLARVIDGCDYVLNCIGVIKPRIDEQDRQSVERAIRVNSLFPHLLAAAAERTGCRVLQIATDCVYSGRAGGYDEWVSHDATDVYGKTKSLGEVRSPAVHHLRCSIIGPEMAGRPKDSLLEWFLGQPQDATVKGFTNHRWNGVTTLAFARICHGVMSQGIALPPVQHIVPSGSVSKDELLLFFAHHYRKDVTIDEVEAPVAIDRILSTRSPEINLKLWQEAGYSDPPTHNSMIYRLRECK